MKTIAFVNEKGGAGKSTLAINLACALHRAGQKVVLVDADPQGTARDWREASPEGADLPQVVALDRPEMLANSLKVLAAELVVIDTPARAEKMAANVVRAADLVLIPIQPSAADIWAAAAAVKLVLAKRDLGGQVNAGFLASRIAGGTKLGKEVLSGAWNEYGLPLLKASIGNRTAYAQALGDGVSIFNTQDTAAKGEIDALVRELEELQWL